jgi:hypothetical protein
MPTVDSETQAVNQAFDQISQGADRAVKAFNDLVRSAQNWADVADWISPIVAYWVRRNLEKLRNALNKIMDTIRLALSRHTPVLSLIITSFDWLKDVKTPSSEIIAGMAEPASYDFSEWSGRAASSFETKAGIQKDAVAEVVVRADFISKWLDTIMQSNVKFAVSLAGFVADIAGKVVQAAVEATSVIDLPWAISTAASLVGDIVAQAIKTLLEIGERLIEAIGNVRDLAAQVGDHSRLPGGKWPEAVRG